MTYKPKFTVSEVNSLVNNVQLSQNITLTEIAVRIGVSVSILSKWKNGKKPISERYFLKLKQLASGGIREKPPDNSFAVIEGQLLQITKQIAMLQGDVAIVKNEIEKVKQSETEMEKKIREHI